MSTFATRGGNDADEVSAGPFRVTVVTLFPDYFRGPLEASLLGKAVVRGDVLIDTVNPRDFATDRHCTVDDTPYGGGPGMVLKPGPVVEAIEVARRRTSGAEVIMMTPQGRQLTAAIAQDLGARKGLILLCGRYEGIDERIRAFVDDEISVGDYVLSGGEPAALVVIDAVTRFVGGVLGNRESLRSESFVEGLLEYPQYTRPCEFRGMKVPDILLSGDHGRVDSWRRGMALLRTRQRRADLFEQLELSEDDERLIDELSSSANEMETDDGREAVD